MSLIKKILKATGVSIEVDLDERIPDMDTPWEGYLGERVEEFIKEQIAGNASALADCDSGKAGYIAFLGKDEGTGSVTVGIFASASTYNEWEADREGKAELLLSSVEIPASGGGSAEVSYIVKLLNMGEKTVTATKKADLVARLRATSQEYDPSTGEKTDTNENVHLTIETKMDGAADWRLRGEMDIPSQPSDNASTYTEVDLSPYIASGTQSVRFQVVGVSSNKKSSYVNMTVTLTDVGVTFDKAAWQQPYRQADSISIPLYISGTIDKELNLRITGADGYSKSYNYDLGKRTYTEAPYQAIVQHPQGHGVYKVEAWLTSGTSISTERKVLNIMCVVAGSTSPLLVINNLAEMQNWSEVKAFDYACYNPSADTTDVHFRFSTSDGEHVIADEVVTGVKNLGDPKSLTVGIEVETGDTNDFDAQFSFTEPSEGTVLLAPVTVTIDNSENFAPTSGADFILNPKLRNNSEEDPRTITNAANGQAISATFEGMGFGKSDGWVSDDDGARCLRVLDGQKVNIAYDAYSDSTATDGLTIEVDFAARNITERDGHLLDMNTLKSVDKLPIGFWLMAQEGCFMTEQRRTQEFQNINYSQDTRTHVAVNIVPRLYGRSINYVRIFVNGIIYREFVYALNDSFMQNGRTGGIAICPSGGDIDIYGMRIYKRSMSAEDIRQDYLASMATVAEKKTFKQRNDILGESGLISYAKSYDKYNTLLYKGKVPTKLSPGSVTLDIDIHKPGDPAHSGTLHQMTIKGQGSTSKNYALWNLQSDFKEADSKWVDENGEDHGQCYRGNDELPLAKKLVDKRNWASSPQSHKMGATKMYNDLYHAIVGKNEITSISGKENCRVAVYEEPFLVFEQGEGDAEPVFIGMGTFGSGKADKPTFGYDSEGDSKDMLMIEGSDNNPRLTKHQVPWIDGDVVYSEEEEGWTYGGITSWDYDLGNPDTISRFKDASNFVYLHSNRLAPFEGTLSELRAKADQLDISKQYWVTIAESGSARYDCYRYEDISGQWVAAGITKSEDGTYATLNVREQMLAYLQQNKDFASHENTRNWAKLNEDFVSARVSEFADKAGSYFHKRDILFSMACYKLQGGTDNRVKNTYLWTFSKDSLIRAMADDVDTILGYNNMGQNKNPYYIEEHDKDAAGSDYWNGEDNNLYNLMELAYGEEIRQMMNAILSEMARVGGTVMGYWQKYFLDTCQWFPAVAYNEWARIAYETAKQQMEDGTYTNDTDPITQSLGSQEEGERQWMADRTTYMSSYAMYGEFAPKPTGGAITYRSNQQAQVRYSLTAAMWLYPVIAVGETAAYFGHRTKAGETVTYDAYNGNNTQNTICGVNHMSDIGTWYDKPADGSFAFLGSRIKSLNAGTDDKAKVKLKIATASIGTLASLRHLDMHNLSTLQGNLDMGKLMRLEDADLRGTAISTITLPEQDFLASLRLPATMTSIRIEAQRGLQSVEMEGCAYLQSVYVDASKAKGLDIKSLISLLMGGSSEELTSISLLGVDLADVTATMLTWLLDRGARVTGRIAMAQGEKVDYALKQRMLAEWGSVDNEHGDLYVSYRKIAMEDFAIKGKYYCTDGIGDYPYIIVPSNTSANNFTQIVWTISETPYATIDPRTGVLTAASLGTNEEKPIATITATATLEDGETVVRTFEVGLYDREPEVGDYVYSDGTTLPIYIADRSVVGVIFFIREEIETGKRWKYVCPKNYVFAPSNFGMWGVDSATFPSLKLADDDSFDLFDLPNDNSTYTNGPLNDTTTSYIEVDGRLKYLSSNILTANKEYDLYAVGDMIPAGLWNTLSIINARNKLLTDSSVNREIPAARNDMTEAAILEEYMRRFVELNGNDNNYAQYYFPHASRAYAYEPSVKDGEELAEKFKAHHWWLPSGGEMKAYMIAGNTGLFDKNIKDGYLTFNKNWTISSSESYSTNLKRIGALQVFYGYDFIIPKSQAKEYMMPITAFV